MLRPILRRKKRVIRPIKVRIGNLSAYTKLSICGHEQRYLRPRAARLAAANRQHVSNPLNFQSGLSASPSRFASPFFAQKKLPPGSSSTQVGVFYLYILQATMIAWSLRL